MQAENVDAPTVKSDKVQNQIRKFMSPEKTTDAFVNSRVLLHYVR